MTEKKDKYGRRYCEVDDTEIKMLGIKYFYTQKKKNGKRQKIIAPIDCKHENYIVERGVPSNVKQCLDCIHWEFTKENPTVN